MPFCKPCLDTRVPTPGCRNLWRCVAAAPILLEHCRATVVSITSLCLQEFSKHTQDVLSQNPTELVYYLRVTLQHLISAAHKGQEPLLSYRLSNKSQPAVQTLLKVAAGLSHSGGLPPGMFLATAPSVCKTELFAD